MERLDKITAQAASLSRAEARRLILKGRVCVNGNGVRDIGFQIDPQADIVLLNGKALTHQKYVYIMMNKPAGVLCATEDRAQKTVLGLLDEAYARRSLFPVGRLDKDTTGLLLLTDDGDFAHRLLSPRNKVPKEYIVGVDGIIDETVCEGFAAGVTLADGTQLAPAHLQVLDGAGRASVTIIEGKYHQIKRMFGVFNLPVISLKRVCFAGLTLPKNLAEGAARELTPEELQSINNTKIISK